MIYSRFGTKLTPISKERDGNGQTSIQATADGALEPRTYSMNELKADDGMPEINDVVAKLPWRTVPDRPRLGDRRFR